MSEILLKADDARNAAEKVRNAASNAEDEFNSLREFLGNLGDSFRGQTATAFEERFATWKSDAEKLNESLTSLGEFLGKAADSIEQVDTDLANNLRS